MQVLTSIDCSVGRNLKFLIGIECLPLKHIIHCRSINSISLTSVPSSYGGWWLYTCILLGQSVHYLYV